MAMFDGAADLQPMRQRAAFLDISSREEMAYYGLNNFSFSAHLFAIAQMNCKAQPAIRDAAPILEGVAFSSKEIYFSRLMRFS